MPAVHGKALLHIFASARFMDKVDSRIQARIRLISPTDTPAPCSAEVVLSTRAADRRMTPSIGRRFELIWIMFLL